MNPTKLFLILTFVSCVSAAWFLPFSEKFELTSDDGEDESWGTFIKKMVLAKAIPYDDEDFSDAEQLLEEKKVIPEHSDDAVIEAEELNPDLVEDGHVAEAELAEEIVPTEAEYVQEEVLEAQAEVGDSADDVEATENVVVDDELSELDEEPSISDHERKDLHGIPILQKGSLKARPSLKHVDPNSKKEFIVNQNVPTATLTAPQIIPKVVEVNEPEFIRKRREILEKSQMNRD